MIRYLILVALIVACLVGSCGGEVRTYTDSGQTISIGVNQEFTIALGSNPTTGYSWQESHDLTTLKLVEKTYEQGKQGVVGAGGVELFRFKALKKGRTEITLAYKRPWEQEILDKKMFTVDVK